MAPATCPSTRQRSNIFSPWATSRRKSVNVAGNESAYATLRSSLCMASHHTCNCSGVGLSVTATIGPLVVMAGCMYRSLVDKPAVLQGAVAVRYMPAYDRQHPLHFSYSHSRSRL